MDDGDKGSSTTRTLRRALEMYRTLELLAIELGVSVDQLQLWIDGHQVPPHNVFLKALDLAFRNTIPLASEAVIAKKPLQ
jgi:hypothetical protein